MTTPEISDILHARPEIIFHHKTKTFHSNKFLSKQLGPR